MGPVLAAIDFSDVTDKVLDEAALLARALGTGLVIVHVAAGEPALAGYDKDDIATFTRDDRAGELRGEHEQLADLAARVASADLPVEPLLIMGDTVDRLLHEAERKDVPIIVAGSHGHGGLHHLLLGSISEALVRHADRPVLIVPARPAH